VKRPPPPFSASKERVFFNALALLHRCFIREPADSDFRALAKELKARANCAAIFPARKLPPGRAKGALQEVEGPQSHEDDGGGNEESAQQVASEVGNCCERAGGKVSQAAEDNLTAAGAADDSAFLAAGTSDNDDMIKHNDGGGRLSLWILSRSTRSHNDHGNVKRSLHQLISAPKQVACAPPAKEREKNKTLNCCHFPLCKKMRHKRGGAESEKCSDRVSGEAQRQPSNEEISEAEDLGKKRRSKN
jgi:hypothetical protein